MSRNDRAKKAILKANERVAKANQNLSDTIAKYFPEGSDISLRINYGSKHFRIFNVSSSGGKRVFNADEIGVVNTTSGKLRNISVPYLLEAVRVCVRD